MRKIYYYWDRLSCPGHFCQRCILVAVTFANETNPAPQKWRKLPLGGCPGCPWWFSILMYCVRLVGIIPSPPFYPITWTTVTQQGMACHPAILPFSCRCADPPLERQPPPKSSWFSGNQWAIHWNKWLLGTTEGARFISLSLMDI